MKLIEVSIPQAKLKKLAEGKVVTLSAHELTGTQKIHVHPETYNKIVKARKHSKGVRISISQPEILHDMRLMEGGSLWSFLKEKVWPVLKTTVLPALADAGFGALGSYAGQPALAGTARSAFKEVTGIGMKMPTKVRAEHTKAHKGRFVKGSAEAKAYMASIRGKKKMAGGSFRLA
jgi:hypothetical protein